MSKNRKPGRSKTVQTGLHKSPALTPGATAVSLNPGFGSGGGIPSTQSPSAARGLPTDSPSKYTHMVTDVPNLIADVDPSRNWFSPMQPMVPFGSPHNNFPREYDYNVGQNLNFVTPRMQLMAKMRLMSRSWGTLRAIIQTRKDQMIRLPWEIQVRGKPRQSNKHTEEMKTFFRKPDGKRRFVQWARMILEDLFVIDAPTLYIGHRSMAGLPLCVEVLDGATIKVLIDDAGRIPDYPSPAYQQIIKGMPLINLDESELIYAPMNLTPENPIHGYSPVEQIYMEVQEAIKKTMYTLGFWTDGNLPDLIMSVPKEWTPTQLAAYQALMDSELAGNVSQKSKMRFVPEGMKPYDVKNASGEGLSSGRDEMLIRLACYAFSVSPTPFIKGVNRATAQSSAEQATQEGLYPLMQWFKECVMDRIIQDEFGYEDVEFSWKAQPEIDQLKRSQVFMNYVRAGIMTINEIRDQMDMIPVVGGEEILIYTNNGVAKLQDAIKAGALAAVAPPVNDNFNNDGRNSTGGGKPSGSANPNTRSDAGKSASGKPLILMDDLHEDIQDTARQLQEVQNELAQMEA